VSYRPCLRFSLCTNYFYLLYHNFSLTWCTKDVQYIDIKSRSHRQPSARSNFKVSISNFRAKRLIPRGLRRAVVRAGRRPQSVPHHVKFISDTTITRFIWRPIALMPAYENRPGGCLLMFSSLTFHKVRRAHFDVDFARVCNLIHALTCSFACAHI
jgi:hypothetical protein